MGGTTGSVPEAVTFLFGSESRLCVLAALEDGPRRQAAVARECGVGRSTVHRCVQTLERHDWVHEVEGGYTLTAAGRRVLSAYRSFARTVERVHEHEPLLRCLEGTGVTVPTDTLADAEVVTATDHDPHAPVAASAEVLDRTDADHARVAWSGVSPITNDAGETHLADGGTVEMVVDRHTMVASRESYFENYQLALASDRLDLYVATDSFDVGVLVAGDRAVITGYEDGRPTVCVHGTDDDLRDCARRLYERARARADRLEVRYPHPGETRRVSRSRTAMADGDGRGRDRDPEPDNG